MIEIYKGKSMPAVKLPKPPTDDLQQVKASLKETYSRGADVYDAERSVNARASYFFETVYGTLNEMIGPTDETTLHVDMPVGTGRFLYYLRDAGRRHRMVGIDIAPGMIRVSREAARARGEDMPLSFGDAFALPLATGSVDVLTSLRFFHLFPKRYWPALLAEMHRVLKPGGLLIAEMRNVFRGVAGAIIKEYRDRWFRADQAHSFIWPHQVTKYFGDFCDVRARGAGLDGLDLLASHAPGLIQRTQKITRQVPWRYLSKELLIRARKPQS